MRSVRPVLVFLLAAALATGSGSAVSAASGPSASPDSAGAVTPSGSATPDDAVRAYLAALAGADIDGILSATAIDEMSAGFRFDLQSDRLQAFQPMNMLGPNDDPFLEDLDRAQLTWQILSQVRAFTYGLLSDIDMDGVMIVPFGKEEADAFAAQVDPSQLASISVVAVQFPNPEFEQNARYLENNAKMAAIYGADEVTERVATFDYGGELWQVGFTLIRYGDAWKVMRQAAPLANLPVTGVPQRVSDS